MIWISQTIIAIFCCKDILHKNWIEVIFCLEYFCHEQLQIALMNSRGFIYKIISTIIEFRLSVKTCFYKNAVKNYRGSYAVYYIQVLSK